MVLKSYIAIFSFIKIQKILYINVGKAKIFELQVSVQSYFWLSYLR